jgi:hypothetical protein
MDDVDYVRYEYARYRPRKSIFVYILIPVLLACGFFIANLIFGFVSFKKQPSKNNQVECAQIKFYISTSPQPQSKSEAMRTAAEISRSGGSGYLIPVGKDWQVVNDIALNQAAISMPTEMSAQIGKIKLASSEHAELVSGLVSTFKTTFETLCGFIESYKANELSSKDIADQARLAYNTLLDMRGELEIIQKEYKNQYYNDLLAAVTYELFGLNLLWLDTGANFSHTLKNSASWVIFAYKDLTESLKI